MLSFCLKCRKNSETKNQKVVNIKNGRIILLSNCSACNSKKMKCLKEQEARELLNSLGIRAPLLGSLLF